MVVHASENVSHKRIDVERKSKYDRDFNFLFRYVQW